LDGEKHLALVRERQRDFIRGTLKHIDFQVVSMKEKLRTSVSVVIVGESPAVKDFNGVLVTGLDEVEVECFPQDLPERIMADISGLKQIGDAIYVRNLVISEKVEVLEDPNEVVVVVTAQAAEEVEEVVVEEVVAEPELIEKGKKEEEEEGEAEE
jgi:large subunit ribosomal protein L25